jgi:hypothetical protein
MADTVRKVNYFKLTVPDKPGEGARILDSLRGLGVNLSAFSGFPVGRRAQLDFIPEDPAGFQKAARRAHLKIGAKKTAFLVQGEDRAGALADIYSKLASAKINVVALQGVTAGAGRYGAIFWVKPKDVSKAATVLWAV